MCVHNACVVVPAQEATSCTPVSVRVDQEMRRCSGCFMKVIKVEVWRLAKVASQACRNGLEEDEFRVNMRGVMGRLGTNGAKTCGVGCGDGHVAIVRMWVWCARWVKNEQWCVWQRCRTCEGDFTSHQKCASSIKTF